MMSQSSKHKGQQTKKRTKSKDPEVEVVKVAKDHDSSLRSQKEHMLRMIEDMTSKNQAIKDRMNDLKAQKAHQQIEKKSETARKVENHRAHDMASVEVSYPKKAEHQTEPQNVEIVNEEEKARDNMMEDRRPKMSQQSPAEFVLSATRKRRAKELDSVSRYWAEQKRKYNDKEGRNMERERRTRMEGNKCVARYWCQYGPRERRTRKRCNIW